MATRINYNSIKSALADKGKKNLDLAAALGVSSKTVSKWVTNTNQPSVKDLYRVAGFLKIRVDKLLIFNNPDSTEPHLPAKSSTASNPPDTTS